MNPLKYCSTTPTQMSLLRSRDSQVFHILKLYIIESSSVLEELIQAACETFGADDFANAQIRLPEVHLSESSPILSSLFTFIFPVTLILPSSLEEAMELLSVATKYEMSSVIRQIRDSLSRQHPPLLVQRTLSSLTHLRRGTDFWRRQARQRDLL
jgi:hypothetical protein